MILLEFNNKIEVNKGNFIKIEIYYHNAYVKKFNSFIGEIKEELTCKIIDIYNDNILVFIEENSNFSSNLYSDPLKIGTYLNIKHNNIKKVTDKYYLDIILKLFEKIPEEIIINACSLKTEEEAYNVLYNYLEEKNLIKK